MLAVPSTEFKLLLLKGCGGIWLKSSPARFPKYQILACFCATPKNILHRKQDVRKYFLNRCMYHIDSSKTVAYAFNPSSRPMEPSFSVVVALTDTSEIVT